MKTLAYQFSSVSSVAQLCPTFYDPMDCSIPDLPVHHQLLEPNQTHVHWGISSSVVPFFFHPQSSPASGSFPVSQLFTSGGQSTGASASTSVLPKNTQDWSPLGFTDLHSLLSKRLSRIFSSTTIWKHRFFGTQPSLWFNSYIQTWLLEKP